MATLPARNKQPRPPKKNRHFRLDFMPTVCPDIITNKTQMQGCVNDQVQAQFWARAKVVKGQTWVTQQQIALLGGYAQIPSALIFQLVPVVQTTPGVTVIVGQQVQQVGATYEETHPRSLAEANHVYAAELMSDAPLDLVRRLAADTGVVQNQPELQMRAGVAIVLAAVATKADQLIPQAIEQERARAGAAGSSFFEKFNDGLKKLVTHPGDWLQRVFVTEPGKAIQWAGRQLLSDAIPNWARWIIDPLGLAKQFGTFLREIGAAMVEGSISAFEEQEFMKANARHWQQVGLALATAAPFLPPPWNVVAAAAAAVFTAAGTAILRMYAQADLHRQQEAQAAALAAQAAVASQKASQAQAQTELFSALAGPTVPHDAQPEAPAKVFGVDLRTAIFIGLGALTLWAFNATSR